MAQQKLDRVTLVVAERTVLRDCTPGARDELRGSRAATMGEAESGEAR